MNTDHPVLSWQRVIRLMASTAFFAIACGIPASLEGVFAALRALLVVG